MEENTTTQAEGNSETNQSTQAKNDNMIPQSRLNEVISERNELRNQIGNLNQKFDGIQADQKAKREESMKKNDEWKTLLDERTTELEKANKVATKWTNYEDARRKTLTGKLSEEKQKFATSMPLTDLEEFVDLETKSVNANITNSSRAGVNPSGEFGGFSSYAEWAMKDPKGCEAHLANTTVGYIK